MLSLTVNAAKIIKAKRAFHEGMTSFIFGRIDNIHTLEKCNTHVVDSFFSNLINDHIDTILIAPPKELAEFNRQIKPFIEISPDFKKGIEYVFNYDLFVTKAVNRYDGYRLAEALDINTCPYCNRNYTCTIIRNNDKKKIARPQFDHYFDKGRNPLLAVSFYNLIPSCSICNSSVKHDKEFNLDDYLHPYIDDAIDEIKFTYGYSVSSKSGLRVKVSAPTSTKAENTITAFAIEEVYNAHTGELADLLKTRRYFSERYLSILSAGILKDVIVSQEDLYRIVFGTEYRKENFINRPFSKFKNDILKELHII